MRHLKKLIAVAAALVMVLVMSVTSFAADNPTSTGSIAIEKNLKAINATLTSVDGPGATFTYAIASVEPSADNGGTTITDGTNTGTVHAGPADGVTLSSSTISYPIGTAVNASASGADNVKSITATGDISKFSAPGIYRYNLTETSTSTATISQTDGTRYLDVYVEQGTTSLEFSGFVMHDGGTSNGAPSNKATFADATFTTVNIHLTQNVSGNMADKNHAFPFAITTSDNGRWYKAGTTVPTDSTSSATATSQSTSLTSGASYYIYGLAQNATVNYTETNDTSDTYQVAITGGTESAATSVAANGTKVMGVTTVTSAGTVTFTNTLESVSPTGVVLRFGAPLLLLAAGIALVMINRKSKKADVK